jgi:threonine dehydrogenase-like Zn-dependent dehydrogenase
LRSEGVAQVIEISEPKSEIGNVLLKVELVGLCGTDLNSFRGRNPMVTYPRVLGHEIAATVVEGTVTTPVGTRVTVNPYTNCGVCKSCSCGRFNACKHNQTLGVQRDGGLTTFISMPESKIYASSLSLKELCLVEPLTIGMHAVSRGRVTEQDTVVIFGCGGVGLGAIAGASSRGARVIAVDLDEEKLETARGAGAKDLVHSGTENFRLRIRELTEGHGPDVVIEAIGLRETFVAAVEEVAFSGRVVYIGYAKEHVSYETKLFVQKELDILGSRNAQPKDFHEVIRLLEESQFPVDRTVTAVVSMEEAPALLSQWSASPASFTKIMVKI